MCFQRVIFIVLVVVAVLGPCSMVALGTSSQDASDLRNQAMANFLAGRIERSVAEFDQIVELAPEMGPYLWQRGIALYYMGRYDDCRAQFESHRTVNPNDVENAAWHFLCFARLQSPEEARKALLPVGHDSREPMMTIYKVFRGEDQPEELLPVISAGALARFCAHLYLGLYYEALGREVEAYQYISVAADDDYGIGGYMHGVAKLHLAWLQREQEEPPEPPLF
jgi:lipoprotein NlpI